MSAGHRIMVGGAALSALMMLASFSLRLAGI